MNTIKVLPTTYRGVRFKSRTEARWAIFFDALGVPWEYEREGYDLGDNIYYVPDFYIPPGDGFYQLCRFKNRIDEPCWAEVKGQQFTVFERAKCERLATQTNMECLLLIGSPTNDTEVETIGPFDADQDGPSGDFFCLYRPHVQAIEIARVASFDRRGHYIP